MGWAKGCARKSPSPVSVNNVQPLRNAVLAGMSTIIPPKQRQRLREAILLYTRRRYALMVLGLVNEM
jgi:hypothetical protein